MKILSLNVRGLGRREKRSKVKKLVSNLKVDMLLLQETKLKDLKPIILQSIWGISEVESVHVDADGSAGGLITLWSPSFFIFEDTQSWVFLFRSCFIGGGASLGSKRSK